MFVFPAVDGCGTTFAGPTLQLAGRDDVTDDTRRRAKMGWLLHWGGAVVAGALLAVVAASYFAITPANLGSDRPLMNTIAAWTVWFVQMLVLPVPAAYAVIWCVETVKGQCSRLVGAIAVAGACGGAVAAVIGVGQALPATSWWMSSSLSAFVRDQTPALSADIAADLRSARPWLYVAAAVSLAIVCGPRMRGRHRGRLDYRTVNVARYLTAADYESYATAVLNRDVREGGCAAGAVAMSLSDRGAPDPPRPAGRVP
ncbi:MULTISPECIES: hypothetical protein [Gordonia]|nr:MULTISPECIES: hypothetical protein [Gordonia]MDT0223701.1 hypothetical protein [Gordonia sp. AC31]SCC61038.1 hypothetical protein GA0061091_1463 [Gordonia sp. v-85]